MHGANTEVELPSVGITPLIMAAQSGHFQIVQVVFEVNCYANHAQANGSSFQQSSCV